MANHKVHSRDLVVQKMTRDGLKADNKSKGISEHISNREIDKSFQGYVDDINFDSKDGREQKSQKNERIERKQYLNNTQNVSTGDKQDGLDVVRQMKWLGKIEKNERTEWKQYLNHSNTLIDIKQDGLDKKREWLKKIEKNERIEWKEYIRGSKGPPINFKKIIKKDEILKRQNEKPFSKSAKKEETTKTSTSKTKIKCKKELSNNSFLKNKVEQEIFKKQNDNMGLKAIHMGYSGTRRMQRGTAILNRMKSEEHKFRYIKKEWKRENRKKLKQKVEEKIFEEDNNNTALKAVYLGNRGAQKVFRTSRKIIDKIKKNSKHTKPINKQKERYKKQYANDVRKKSLEQVKQFAEKNLKEGAKKLLQLLATHNASLIALCLSALGGLLLYFYIIGAGISFLQMILTEVYVGTYQTDYGSMTDCDSIFRNLESRLEERINLIETEFLSYDEYRYKLGKIGHDPNLLLAYLGAKLQGFTPEMAEEEIVEIFNLMYNLDLTEEIEIRTRLVQKEDPITGEMKDVEEEYKYYILHVILTVNDLKIILSDRLTEEEKKQFKIYQSTGGGQNIYPNPLDFDWHSSITSQFGYRIHPISGDLKFHSGVDIAAPKGAPIFSSMEGTVIKSGENGGYGLSVEIVNENGDRTRYAHCSKLLVTAGQEVKRRDKIAEVGSTGNSTGNHLHFEFINADGTYLNPLFIVSNYNKEKIEK